MPVVKYGRTFPDVVNGNPHKWNDLEIEAHCFLGEGTERFGGIPKSQHFRNITKILWGYQCKKRFIWHPWADDMLEEACVQSFCHFSGCASCVAGHTKILNPITGEQPTIEELYDRQEAPIVMTIHGATQAGIPFIKGESDLYEMVLENGKRFTCTAEHLVLTRSGFVKACSVFVGEQLLSYEPFHPQSTSGTVPLIHRQDVLNSRKTVQDYQGGCLAYSCLCGGQPLAEEDSDQSFSPSLAGVQEYKAYACDCSDGSGNESICIRPYQRSLHPSTSDTFLRQHSKETFSFLPRASRTPLRDGRMFQQLSRWNEGTPFRRSSSLQVHDFCYTQTDNFPCEEYKVSPVRVQAISKTGYGKFYDLKVPNAHHYFAEGAIHHNSGKSDFLAVWGIVNWLVAPHRTLSLFTSTSLKEARQRVWGSVIQYFSSCSDAKGRPILPGKIVDSQGMIRTFNGVDKFSDKCGLHLITGEKKKEKENIGKMIGLKNSRVILCADELAELSLALAEAAKSNLISNPYFQFLSASNFKGIYDAFGVETKPKAGWNSLNPEMTRWETENGGVCLRFDGLLSPNILAGEDKWPIYGNATLEKHKKAIGENTAAWWRMVRSYPCQDADSNRIYTDADFIRGDVQNKVVRWKDPPQNVASLDPAFVTGGDKAISHFGKLGISTEGKQTLLITERIEIREDMRRKDESRPIQVAKQYRDLCITRNIPPEYAGYDSSGGGVVFGSLLSELWSTKLLGVQFGGAASERIVNIKDKRPAKEAYSNRVTELWFGGTDFIHSGQIKGLPSETADEMKERRIADSVKTSSGLKVRVERKDEMKLRISKSPDSADSFFILLELCRARLGFTPVGMEGKRVAVSTTRKTRINLVNSIYSDIDYSAQEMEEVAA